MTEPAAVDLLRHAESYLSALHGSVARHDNLAANLACAGCELRDQIRAALAVPVSSPADQTALRDRIVAALKEADYDLPVEQRHDLADAVLPVLPEPADRAAILTGAADFLRGLRMTGTAASVQDIETDLREQAVAARRLAAEAQPTTKPETVSHGSGAAGRGAAVTDNPPPVCQWCEQPVTGQSVYWDGRPQCPDPIRCEQRRRAQQDGAQQ
ncbi:hypothetical protein [Streptomyces sp. NPDC046862]|uniref:hypothetical protein n=1 Tax=Streptomyces sp. NPDC046862 TaxID=3154603 RepID=UPI0034522211